MFFPTNDFSLLESCQLYIIAKYKTSNCCKTEAFIQRCSEKYALNRRSFLNDLSIKNKSLFFINYYKKKIVWQFDIRSHGTQDLDLATNTWFDTKTNLHQRNSINKCISDKSKEGNISFELYSNFVLLLLLLLSVLPINISLVYSCMFLPRTGILMSFWSIVFVLKQLITFRFFVSSYMNPIFIHFETKFVK